MQSVLLKRPFKNEFNPFQSSIRNNLPSSPRTSPKRTEVDRIIFTTSQAPLGKTIGLNRNCYMKFYIQDNQVLHKQHYIPLSQTRRRFHT